MRLILTRAPDAFSLMSDATAGSYKINIGGLVMSTNLVNLHR